MTGLGMATCLGLHVEETWRKVLAGVSGISTLDSPSTEHAPIRAAGAISEENWSTVRAEFSQETRDEGERKTLIALWAAKRALEDAGLLDRTGRRDRYGVALASGIGINRIEDLRAWIGKDRAFDFESFGRQLARVHRESIMRNPSDRPSALVAHKFDFRGMNATLTAACASATQAIGAGFRVIRRGEADVMAVGGSDTMFSPVGLIFFVLLNAVSTSRADPQTVCRPFDSKRSGLVMAEGAAVAILEDHSHAIARGAKTYCEVVGYGSSLDAHQLTRPHPEGRGAVQSMRAALDDADLGTDAIDYINAHGTGTRLNDVIETVGIKRLFGARAHEVPVSSSKSMIGHTLAASGAPEFVLTVLTVARDEIHPTINLTHPDPECDLDYVPGVKRKRVVNAAISNSFGFGGQNATVVVGKHPDGRQQ